MTETNDSSEQFCPQCEQQIVQDAEYCPVCGSVFADGIQCTNHPEREAEAVCVVCSNAFCLECAGVIQNAFLCEDHQKYEIEEGLIEVFPSIDDTMAQYVASCLVEAGLHPLHTKNRGNNLDGFGVNISRVMIPCSEVLEAEKVIQELEIQN